jgi:hypothetical protein
VDDPTLAGDAFRLLAESVHPLALGNVKRNVEQIWQLAKKLIRLHTPDSHLIGRTEATALGLPVEQPSAELERLLLAYYERLKADLELLEKFDSRALPADQSLVLERGIHRDPDHLRQVRDARARARALGSRRVGRSILRNG